MPSLEELYRTEWNDEFIAYCRRRMVMGAFRYGRMSVPAKLGYDNVGSAIMRLELFLKEGNLEHLCDVANLCLIEYTIGRHPLRHWKAGDDGVHTQRKESTC